MFATIFITLSAITNFVFGTFTDADYSVSQINFATSQTVYFKLVSLSSGAKVRDFFVLNENKQKVMNLEVHVSGSGPYTYTANFNTPETSGVYYIDVMLDNGQGVTFAGQRNFNVGPGNSVASSSVSTQNNEEISKNETLTFESENVLYTQDEAQGVDRGTSNSFIIDIFNKILEIFKKYIIVIYSG